MRLRKIPGAEELIEKSEFCITESEQYKGKWASVFGKDTPIELEIGMGKGRFLMTLAERHPEKNFLGIELYPSVLLRAVQKIEETPLPNVRFLCVHAEHLPEIFAPDEIEKIYLNFSDPWPKERHAKRRLTSRVFLSRYEEILPEGGILEFKTDNRALFDFSLGEFTDCGWKLLAQTTDLHHDETLLAGNVMTEYEEKFVARYTPICKLIAARP